MMCNGCARCFVFTRRLKPFEMDLCGMRYLLIQRRLGQYSTDLSLHREDVEWLVPISVHKTYDRASELQILKSRVYTLQSCGSGFCGRTFPLVA